MPIWAELVATMLFAYLVGLSLGWLVWAQPGADDIGSAETDMSESGPNHDRTGAKEDERA